MKRNHLFFTQSLKTEFQMRLLLRALRSTFEIIDERQHGEEFSTLFYYLPSITERKEKINQNRYNVNFNPIDCSLDFLNDFFNLILKLLR